jgi:hypothetical protein
VLDDYNNAVDQYRQAIKLNNLWEASKEPGKRQPIQILKSTIPGAATAYAIKSALSKGDESMSHYPRSAQRLVKPSTGATRSSTSCHRSP